MIPILVRRSFRTPPRLPQLMRQSLDLGVPEWHEAVRSRRRSALMRFPGVLQGLTRVFGSRQVILAPVLFRGAVRVRGAVVQFGSALVILVIRSVVLTS